jgi:hypothetical protein
VLRASIIEYIYFLMFSSLQWKVVRTSSHARVVAWLFTKIFLGYLKQRDYQLWKPQLQQAYLTCNAEPHRNHPIDFVFGLFSVVVDFKWAKHPMMCILHGSTAWNGVKITKLGMENVRS